MSKKEGLRIAVTGVNGFVGGHLVSELVRAGHEVVGVSREDAAHSLVAEQLSAYHHVDLMDLDALSQLDWKSFDCVIHLAGLAAVGASFDQPQLYHDVNTGVIRNLFEAAKAAGATPRIVAISTGAVYGRTDGPVTEGTDLHPGSPYAESKRAAELVVEEYREKGFTDSINVRPFNHAGPRQAPGFLIPDLGYQIAEGKNPVDAGNLSSSRDYTDVRDVVRAYRLLAEAETLAYPVYNVCSGKSVRGEDIFEMLKMAAGKPEVTVRVAKERLRAQDDDIIVGSHDRLKAETGWQPEIAIDQTVQDFYNSIKT